MTTHPHSATVASSGVALAPASPTHTPPRLAGAQLDRRIQMQEFVDNFSKGRIAGLWRCHGKNTQEIAKLVGLRECDVCEQLHEYIDARFFLKAGTTSLSSKRSITLPKLKFMEAMND